MRLCPLRDKPVHYLRTRSGEDAFSFDFDADVTRAAQRRLDDLAHPEKAWWLRLVWKYGVWDSHGPADRTLHDQLELRAVLLHIRESLFLVG